MVLEIVKNVEILSQKSTSFDLKNDEDIALLRDMLDTAEAHKDNCVGLAAIQVGVAKRAILVRQGDSFVPLINPVIIKKFGNCYTATEGCLSLDGEREVKRYPSVKLMWTNLSGKRLTQTFYGFTAEIIQHEVDHCNGILCKRSCKPCLRKRYSNSQNSVRPQL